MILGIDLILSAKFMNPKRICKRIYVRRATERMAPTWRKIMYERKC